MNEDVRILRAVRLMRLAKLLRVLKARRVLYGWHVLYDWRTVRGRAEIPRGVRLANLGRPNRPPTLRPAGPCVPPWRLSHPPARRPPAVDRRTVWWRW